jgi:hypothetical protein
MDGVSFQRIRLRVRMGTAAMQYTPGCFVGSKVHAEYDRVGQCLVFRFRAFDLGPQTIQSALPDEESSQIWVHVLLRCFEAKACDAHTWQSPTESLLLLSFIKKKQTCSVCTYSVCAVLHFLPYGQVLFNTAVPAGALNVVLPFVPELRH